LLRKGDETKGGKGREEEEEEEEEGGDIPSNRAVVFSPAGKATAELDTSPETWFTIDFAYVFENTFETERFYADVVADVKGSAGATFTAGQDARGAAWRTDMRGSLCTVGDSLLAGGGGGGGG
jgi:hypothetical protein